MGTAHPWIGRPWEASAEAANRGMSGQGYIVHSAMRANQGATRLAVLVIVLTITQAVAALVQVGVGLNWAWVEYFRSTPVLWD